MAELSVEINGKMDKLDKALKNSEKALKGFEKKANKISKTNSNLGSSSVLAARGMKNLRGQTINGNAAMTAFSRTIQDAPFGIMGVSNNITNLTEQFGYLKNKTGSSGGALKAMLKDLKGFGGITLGISLVTSALLVFGDKIFDTKQKVDELTEATKGFIGSAVKEKSILESLLTVARDDSNSREKRLRAVKKINELFPKYLGNLKLEGVNSKDTANKIDELTKSLINQATVKGLLNQISEISAKKFKKEKKTAEEYVTTTNKIGSAFAYLFSTNETYTTALGKGSKTRRDAIGKEATKITELQAAISKLLNENTIDFDSLFGGSSDDSVIKKVFVDFKESYKDEKDYFEDWVEENPITIADNAEWNSIDWEAYFNNKSFEEKALELKARLENLNASANDIIQNSLTSTFAGIGTAIGEAMVNGSNLAQGLGKALLSGIGGMLTQLGKLAIGIGIGIEKIKIALKTLNPGVAIAAGFALVALGAAFSAGASKIGSSGGSSSGGSGGVSNDTSTYSPSSSGFSGQSSSSGFANVVFKIQGTELVGVLSNTLGRNRALGGSLSIT